MSTEISVHALTDAALTLDPADRLALATLLIDSVEDAPDPRWAEVWTEELHRRSAAADARQVRGAPWSEVRARLLRDLASR
jgi:putative addiction module component (TIGR02574 family)